MAQLDELKAAVHQRKQQLLKLKQEQKERMSGFLDQFTKTDELLYYLLQEQRYTNEQLELNNKLLYAIYQQGGAVPSGEFSSQEVDIDIGNRMRTKFLNLETPQVGSNFEVLKVEGRGYVEEIKFIGSTSSTDNKLYSVKITADDNIIYNDSWVNFETRSYHETDVTCFEDDNNSKYVLHFMNFFYIYNFSVEIYNNSAEFTQIYIKYHEEV